MANKLRRKGANNSILKSFLFSSPLEKTRKLRLSDFWVTYLGMHTEQKGFMLKYYTLCMLQFSKGTVPIEIDLLNWLTGCGVGSSTKAVSQRKCSQRLFSL